MTWSKVGTTTRAFTYGGGVIENAVDDTGTGVLEEFVAFLGTRGWTAEQVIGGESSLNISWKLSKRAVANDGGTQDHRYWLHYRGEFNVPAAIVGNRSPVDAGTSQYQQTLMDSTSDPTYLGGKWSFWVSDEDTDSYLVIAEDTGSDHIIGFWPPSGSLYRQDGYNSSTYGYMTAYMWPLMFSNPYPCAEPIENKAFQGLELPHFVNVYMNGFTGGFRTFDYTWVLTTSDRPMFRTFGGDMKTMFDFDGTQFLSTSSWGSIDGALVYEIDGEYWIAWGANAKLLFNHGATPPVF